MRLPTRSHKNGKAPPRGVFLQDPHDDLFSDEQHQESLEAFAARNAVEWEGVEAPWWIWSNSYVVR